MEEIKSCICKFPGERRALYVPEFVRKYNKNTCNYDEPYYIDVDACIADVIQYLWDNDVITLGCCCGHNTIDFGGVHLPWLIIKDNATDDYAMFVVEKIKEVDDHRLFIILSRKKEGTLKCHECQDIVFDYWVTKLNDKNNLDYNNFIIN